MLLVLSLQNLDILELLLATLSFHVYLGFFHYIKWNSFSFVSDLLEWTFLFLGERWFVWD